MDNVRCSGWLCCSSVLLSFSLFFSLLPTRATASNLLGRNIESFEVETLEGETFDLRDHLGRGPVLLNFGATWCGPCRREWPILDRFYRNERSDSLSVLVLDVGESDETVREHWNEEDYEVPVAVVDRSFSEPFAVDAYPTNLIVGPYGRIVYRGEGFDSRIREILSSYAPSGTGVPMDAPSMRPAEFQSAPESEPQVSGTRQESYELSSDSPVRALRFLNDHDKLSSVEEGLSDTTLRSVNFSLERILEDMRSRERYEVAYGNFVERNPELRGRIREFDSPAVTPDPRQSFRALSKAIESLNQDLSDNLLDQFLAPYRYVGFWKSREIDRDLYRFERQYRGNSFTARRKGKKWQFNFPFRPVESGETTGGQSNLPASLAEQPGERINRGLPKSPLDREGIWRNGFKYRLGNRDKGYRLEVSMPSLAGVETERGEENSTLYVRDYLALSSLVGRMNDDETIELGQESQHSSTHHRFRHGTANSTARAKIYRDFTLPDGTSIETVNQLSGTLTIDVPDGLSNHVFHLDRAYRHRSMNGQTVEVVRFGRRGLIVLFEEGVEDLWSLQAFDDEGSLQGYQSSFQSSRVRRYTLDDPVSFLRLVQFDSTRQKAVHFRLPVSRVVRSLPLANGENMSFKGNRIEVRDVAERPGEGNRTTHVKLAVRAGNSFLENTLKANQGLTSDGKRVPPEKIDWDIPGDDFEGSYRILRFEEPVETLQFEMKGEKDGL